MRKTIFASLLALVLSAPVSAALTVTAYDWDVGSKTTFTDCAIDFWHAEAYVDRDMNDGNYLYVSCEDSDTGVPAPSEEPRYESRGISHDEMFIGDTVNDFEGFGCYVTEHVLGTANDSIRVECPINLELRGSFEGKQK